MELVDMVEKQVISELQKENAFCRMVQDVKRLALIELEKRKGEIVAKAVSYSINNICVSDLAHATIKNQSFVQALLEAIGKDKRIINAAIESLAESVADDDVLEIVGDKNARTIADYITRCLVGNVTFVTRKAKKKS